jgi:hypothetical protein
MSQELNSLYDQLREADRLAETGDEQAKIDAQAIYAEIQRLESTSTADSAPTSIGEKISSFVVEQAPQVGTLGGAMIGATQGPNITKKIEPFVQAGVKKIPGQGVKNYIAATTEMPFAGGKDYGTAYEKASIAAGKPIKSRGSEIPMRRGSLGITTQPEPPSFLKRTGDKLTTQTSDPAGRTGSAFRLGAAGSLGGKAIQNLNEGNYGEAALQGTGSLAALAGQSRYKPLRLLGNVVTGAEIAGGMTPFFNSKKPVEEKAAGGLAGYAAGKAVKGGLEATKKLFTPKPTKVVRASEALGPHEGKYLNTTQSDRMRSTGGDLGGPGFSKFQLERPEYEGAAWGVGKSGTATGIVNTNKRYPEGQSIWSPMIGSETQHQSNQHVFDALTNEFNRQARLGKLTPELREKMNAFLMSNKEYAPLFTKGIDVGNPESIAKMGDTFDRRGAISTVLSGKGVGGQKGQIFDYPGIMQEMTDPMTIGAPTHSVGTRLFTLNNQVENRPDLHSAFPYILKGEDMGVAFNPVPKELAIPDWMGLVRDFKGREPGYMDYTRGLKGKGTPFQFIDENYLRRLEEAGHKEGGPVDGYAAGSAVKKAAQSGLGFLKPSAKSHSQDPQVARALEEYLKGNISQEERIAIMNKQLPLRPWTQMPPSYSDEQIKMALMENKRPKALAEVPAGARVGNRLDIPAYTQHGVYVDTTHDLAKGNSPISYNRTGHLKDVEFSSKPNQAVRVGLGTKEQALTPMGAEMGSAKSPFALIKGTNVGTSDEEVRRMMAEMMKDPSYAQIGMDPRRHSQFYDKSTGMPVWAAEEKLQSGPLILAPRRGLEITDWNDPRLSLSDFEGKKYAKGGSTPAWQRSEGKNPSGGLNAAGRASYNRETGGNLKAPQPEGGSRKKSFCARMSGMKKKLTSSETANDPDSRINKSLRKWKC